MDKSFKLTSEVLELSRIYHGIANIPETVLQAHQARRLYSTHREAHFLIMEAEYQAVCGICRGILKDCKGYIFAFDLVRIRGMLNGLEIMTRAELAQIRDRTREFKEAQIPPIFDSAFYAPTTGINSPTGQLLLFPTVDFIIEFGVGSYETNILARKGKKVHPLLIIEPATVADVRAFRRIAFTREGKIDPTFIREALLYILEHFVEEDADRPWIVEWDELVFMFLEDMLQYVAMDQPKTYTPWRGNMEEIKQKRWYLSYDPAIREDILRQYFATAAGQKNTKLNRRLQLLFSDKEIVLAADLQKNVLERLVEDGLTRKDLRLPRQVFIDKHAWEIYGERIEACLCEMVRALPPETLFSNIFLWHEQISIYAGLLSIPRFKNMIDGIRLEIAQGMSDQDFLQQFTGSATRRRASLGKHAGPKAENTVKLREYLMERAHRLLDTTPTTSSS